MYKVKYTVLYYFVYVGYVPVFIHCVQYIQFDLTNYEVYILGLILYVLIFIPVFLVIWTWVKTPDLANPQTIDKYGVFYESLVYPTGTSNDAKIVPSDALSIVPEKGLNITPPPNNSFDESEDRAH